MQVFFKHVVGEIALVLLRAGKLALVVRVLDSWTHCAFVVIEAGIPAFGSLVGMQEGAGIPMMFESLAAWHYLVHRANSSFIDKACIFEKESAI